MEVEIFFSEALLEFFVLPCSYPEYFRNFASQLPDDGSGESRKYWAGHYITEKRHTMLCRLTG